MTRPAPAPAPRSPRTIVISGPSGSGKTSVARSLLRDPRYGRARTATTRPPRGGERDGVDYDFLTSEAFERARRRGDLLENAEVYGHRYGTPKASVAAVLGSGRHCVLVVDVQGATTLRGLPFAAYYVFVDAPSPEELARRLERRGEDDPEEIRRRLRVAERERQAAGAFDLALVNDDVDETARRLAAHAGLEYDPRPRRSSEE